MKKTNWVQLSKPEESSPSLHFFGTVLTRRSRACRCVPKRETRSKLCLPTLARRALTCSRLGLGIKAMQARMRSGNNKRWNGGWVEMEAVEAVWAAERGQ